jgi:hypothetical protein
MFKQSVTKHAFATGTMIWDHVNRCLYWLKEALVFVTNKHIGKIHQEDIKPKIQNSWS